MRFTLFITVLYILSIQIAKESLVAICKHGNEIKVDYMDSMKGIVSIRKTIHADTLELTINIGVISKSQSYEIPISPKIRFIKYGTVLKEISKLPECSKAKVLSGKEALEYMKHNQ